MLRARQKWDAEGCVAEVEISSDVGGGGGREGVAGRGDDEGRGERKREMTQFLHI
jgi:hypothetical protein